MICNNILIYNTQSLQGFKQLTFYKINSRMTTRNYNDEIYDIMTEINQPIGEKNLARRLGTTTRNIRSVLNNSNRYERASPLEVGSAKFDNSKQKTFRKCDRIRKPMRIWKLRAVTDGE